MKEINTYILEKFKINKDTNLDTDLFKVYSSLLDEAFDKAGFKEGDGVYEKDELLNGEGKVSILDYKLTFKGEAKAVSNSTKKVIPRLILKFSLYNSIKVEDNEEILIYGKFLYNNGKQSYSVYSNVVRVLKYIFDYRKISKYVDKGGINGFILTDNLINKITEGIKDLRYYKEEFNSAIKKARFTDSQWNKLVDLCMELFGSETK